MSLIATARAMDDARFLWRVRAAAVTTAATKVNEAVGPEQRYAAFVLDHPMQDDPTLAALVACNTAIADAITVDEFNAVNTEAVPDSDILYVVATIWPTLASRHEGAPSSTPLG